MSLLEVRGLKAGYGEIEVLHGVDLAIEGGEIVTLIGANGAGKTTLMKTISGLVRASAGSIRFGADDITRRRAHEIVASGISQVAEGRAILKRMTVLENLQMGAYVRGGRIVLEGAAARLLEDPSIQQTYLGKQVVWRRRLQSAGISRAPRLLIRARG